MKRSLISEYSGGNLHSSIESKKVKVRKGSGNETSTSIVGGKKNNTKSLRSQNLDANSPSRKKVEKPSKTSVETPFNCSKKKTITPLKPKKRQRRKVCMYQYLSIAMFFVCSSSLKFEYACLC